MVERGLLVQQTGCICARGVAHVCHARPGAYSNRPNPPIERTCHSKLRLLRPAAHVVR